MLNQDENQDQDDSEDSSAASLGFTSLRWWPVGVILLLMVGIKLFPGFLEAPPLPILILGFLGPGVVALLIPVWWLFASRASGREKAIGLLGLAGIAAVSIALLHITMKGMNIGFYQIPAGLAAFGIVAASLASRPASRVAAALVAAMIGFGFWDLLQMHGTTGKFSPEFSWRWSPTPEEEYLRSLASSAPKRPAPADGEVASEVVPVELVSRSTAQWPDFRGANRDSVVRDVALKGNWDTSPPKLIWKSLIGPGWSSFTVAGNKLFTQEQRGDNEAVVCLDTDTGDNLWSYEYPGRFWEAIGGAGPRATPTIGENALFVLGADGHLCSLKPQTGEVIWKRSLQDDAGRKPPPWGWSSSPLLIATQSLDTPLVLVHAGGPDDKGVLAYNAETGEPVWSVASGGHSYSSPQLATISGTEGVLMMTDNGLQFLNAADGNELWEHDWKTTDYRAIQPLVVGDVVLIATSLGMGTRRVSITQVVDEENAWTVTEDWTSLGMKPDFNDFVAYKDHLYGFDGNIFACADLATGERLWKRGRYGNGQVLLLSQEGQLLVTSERGQVILIQASPDKLIELGKFDAIEGKTWNHPVLIDKRLYVRNGKEAACYELP